MHVKAAAVALVIAGACFLAAARSAVDLHRRSSALARQPLWLGPPLKTPAPTPEQITDVAPVAMESAPVRFARKVQRIVAPPVAAVGPVEVDPADAFRFALRTRRASFEHCYEQELKKQASFNGFVVIALSLSAAGRVTGARVQEGNPRDAKVGACIAAQLRQIRLPALTSEADLLIPIQLKAKEQT